MSLPFPRTLRALSADSSRRDALAVAVAAVLFLAWALWFALAPVSVYATAESARIEAPVHAVEARLPGTAVQSNCTVRLFVPRALLQRAELVILDESFAALDPESLRIALRCALRHSKALIVVAHP